MQIAAGTAKLCLVRSAVTNQINTYEINKTDPPWRDARCRRHRGCNLRPGTNPMTGSVPRLFGAPINSLRRLQISLAFLCVATAALGQKPVNPLKPLDLASPRATL